MLLPVLLELLFDDIVLLSNRHNIKIFGFDFINSKDKSFNKNESNNSKTGNYEASNQIAKTMLANKHVLES